MTDHLTYAKEHKCKSVRDFGFVSTHDFHGEIVHELKPFVRDVDDTDSDVEVLQKMKGILEDQDFQSWLEMFYKHGGAAWYQCYSSEDGATKDRHLRQLGHVVLDNGNTLLHVLVQQNLPECVRWLLANYSAKAQTAEWLQLADIAYKSPDKQRTALHTACMHGHVASLEALLEHLSERSFQRRLEEQNKDWIMADRLDEPVFSM